MTAQPFSWDDWWPELHDLVIEKQTDDLEGTVFTCDWRAPLGYSLHCRIVISEVQAPLRVVLEVSGDLAGTVTCQLHTDAKNETRVQVDWRVQTVKPWMNHLAPGLRPLFVWGHHAVMRHGERGFKRHLAEHVSQ